MDLPIISKGDLSKHLSVPLSVEQAQRINNGIRILHRYQQLLNGDGRALLQKTNYLFSPPKPFTPPELINRLDELLIEVPSLNTPHLDLFKRPSRNPFERANKAEHVRIFVELNNGCETPCTFCGVDAPPHLKLMPFPLFLTVADIAGQFESRLRFMDYRSEAFQSRDVLFGANLGHAVTSAFDDLAIKGNLLPLQTHGWPANHKFAQPAAEMLRKMGLRIRRLSIHLFHREFEEKSVAQEAYEVYAERFARAINLLRPATIAFRYDNEDRTNQNRSIGATARFYINHVYPRILPELATEYRILANEGWAQITAGSKVKLELFHNGFRRNLYESEHFTDNSIDLFVKKEKNEAVLIVYPDGMYSLFRSNAVNSPTHELGNLF